MMPKITLAGLIVFRFRGALPPVAMAIAPTPTPLSVRATPPRHKYVRIDKPSHAQMLS